MKELELDRGIIQIVIDKAQQFHAKEEVTFPEDLMSPTEDWAMQVLADHADDPVVLELTSTIDSLEPEQQVALVALMWVGRGDYAVTEWDEALAQARDRWNGRTAEYLIGTPLVADYLGAGLEQFDAATGDAEIR
jgi:hypothetical protein